MGGIQSRFDETNWNTANGGLRLVTDTIDGSEPVPRYSIFTLTKRPRIEYHVHDQQGNLLYTTKAIRAARFYLLGKSGEQLLRVQQNRSMDWKIYSFGKPSFPGQHPARNIGGDICYLKAKLKILGGAIVCYGYGPSREGKNDETGVAQYDYPILQVQEVQSTREEFQSSCSRENNGPLVGYWAWEKQKAGGCKMVKLHLAKGTDIALHCVLIALIHISRKQHEARPRSSVDSTFASLAVASCS